uniref:Mos1 transposase HTH domain-containing protein n=1 Tax=Graphocephala atropunctata TaxID=36148 RepID=A0A1B6MF73_9HEMI
MSENNCEQRYAIKFCVKLGETPTVTFEKLKKAYGDDTLSRAQVFRWYKAFSNGRESVQDDPRSGRSLSSKSDENVKKVSDLVRNDRRLTTKIVSEQLGLNHTTVHQVLRE